MRSNSSAPIRFARKQFFPEGWNDYVLQFLGLFHRYDYIFRDRGNKQWISANSNWRLDDSAILKAIALQNTKYLIGTRAGRKTRYGVLDIDAGSKYHTLVELTRLLETLAAAGLTKSSLYRSSFSEGWHLYVFFEEAMSSIVLHQQLVKLLKLSNFEVAAGTLEVFPHPGYSSVGTGLRLPLQEGFAWIDKRNLEIDCYREEMTATKALERFLDCLDNDANSYGDFLKLKARVAELETIKALSTGQNSIAADNVIPIRAGNNSTASCESIQLVTSIFGHLPLRINAETWLEGRQYHLTGLTEKAQRAKASFTLGHYFFYGDPSRGLPALGYGCADERKHVIQEFLNAHHNGYSKDINRGRNDAFAQIERMANWLPLHKRDSSVQTFTAVVPISWVKENAKRKAGARRRIEDALAALQIRKRAFSTVELQKAAGCGRDTLYKHADIWRQQYEDLASGFFAACPDEYNSLSDSDLPVLDAVSVSSRSPVLKEEIPFGLIAARQVVFELSQKARKEIFVKETVASKIIVDFEQEWRSRVIALTRDLPSAISIDRLKTVLYLLADLLRVAPYEEDANALLQYVKSVRAELKKRCLDHEVFGGGTNSELLNSS